MFSFLILSSHTQKDPIGARGAVGAESNPIPGKDRIIDVDDTAIAKYGLYFFRWYHNFLGQVESRCFFCFYLHFKGWIQSLVLNILTQGTENSNGYG